MYLVFLWRVLSKLHRTVGTPAEPVGVSLHPWVVGRTLEGNVERNGNSRSLRRTDKGGKVLHGAKFRVKRLVSPLGAADGPTATRLSGLDHQRIVFSFSFRGSYRVDGRKVNDIKPHAGNKRHRLHAVAECAVLSGDGAP